MLQEMSARQFDDWQALYVREPWGDERGDMRMARLACAMLQPHTKKRLREADFRFRFNATAPTPEQYRAKSMQRYQMLASAMTRRNKSATETANG